MGLRGADVSREVQVRRKRIQRISDRVRDADFDKLRVATRDEDFEVRSWAVSGLRKLGSRSEPVLIDVLTADSDLSIRAHAAEALAALHSPRSMALITPLLGAKCWSVADQAAFALRSLRPANIDAMAALLSSSDPDVRELAAEILGFSGDPAAVRPLIRVLPDPSRFVRAAAASSLGRLGASAAAPLLEAAQDESQPEVSFAARWALRFIEGSPIEDPIVEYGDAREPSADRDRLRTYYRNSEFATAYHGFTRVCGKDYCLKRYPLPGVPFAVRSSEKSGEEIGRMEIYPSGEVRAFYRDGTAVTPVGPRAVGMTLTIESDGRVTEVVIDPPGIIDLYRVVRPALLAWEFGEFRPGLTFPLKHRLVVEFHTHGRPRYRYGRPWAELDIHSIRVETHQGLLYID